MSVLKSSSSLRRSLLLGVLTLATPVWSADRPVCPVALGAGPLSVQAAVAYGLCQNPDTREAWAQLAAQQAAVAIGRDASYPSLSVEASTIASRTGDTSNHGLGVQARLSYLLFDFGQRAADQAQARALATAAGLNADSTIATVARAIVDAYLAVLKAQGQIDAAGQTLTAATKSLDSAEARYKVGTGTPLDVFQAKAAQAQARLVQVQATSQLATARGELALAMGLRPTLLPAVAPVAELPLSLPFAETDIERLLTEAVAGRAEVKAAQANVQAAEQAITASRAANRPTVSVSAGAGIDDGDGDRQTSGSVGLTLDVPFDLGGGKKARIRQSEAQRDVRLAALERSRQSIEQQAWQAFYSAQSAIETVKAARDSLESSNRAAEVALGRYNAGLGTILDVLNAQSQRASSYQQWVSARYDWLAARTRLAYALGRPFVTDDLLRTDSGTSAP